MKKVLPLILVVVLLLSSCKSGNVKSGIYLNPDSLNTAFSLNEGIYKGTIKVENDNLIITINYPETIKDVNFIVSDNTVSSVYGDISVVQNDLKVKGVFNELYNCYKKLSVVSEFKIKDDFLEYTDNDFSAILDYDGNLLSIEFKKSKFNFK